MKILMINSVCGIGSTGRICTDLATELEKQGHEVRIAYGRGEVPKQFKKIAIRIGNDWDIKLHGLKARLLDKSGFGSKYVTKKFISWIREYNPDVIHLHNIHGYYINISVLFNYLKTCNKKIIWTLHDCWSFTGHCAYFDFVGCNKWKTGCKKCTQKTEYPARIGPDMSNQNYILKKEYFTKINNMILVTPSKWLANLIKDSYLKEYPVIVINNGVDTNIFRHVDGNIKQKFNCQGKKIILGVASVWDRRKGLDDFIELSKKIDDSYKIILVGLNKKQIKKMPHNIIGVEKTDNITELAQLYSAATVFVNPTYEDNYPTTNLEAIACGTPVITYDTGGSPESARMYGISIQKNNSEQLVGEINNIQTIKKNKANINEIDLKNFVKKYINLYRRI